MQDPFLCWQQKYLMCKSVRILTVKKIVFKYLLCFSLEDCGKTIIIFDVCIARWIASCAVLFNVRCACCIRCHRSLFDVRCIYLFIPVYQKYVLLHVQSSYLLTPSRHLFCSRVPLRSLVVPTSRACTLLLSSYLLTPPKPLFSSWVLLRSSVVAASRALPCYYLLTYLPHQTPVLLSGPA